MTVLCRSAALVVPLLVLPFIKGFKLVEAASVREEDQEVLGGNNWHLESISCRSVLPNETLNLRDLKCEPRPTIVYISPEKFSPSAFLLNRCSGVCSINHKCLPIESTNKSFHIKKFMGGLQYCYKITFKEDTKCSCQCLKRATDCHNGQTYVPRDCKCECKNQQERYNCNHGKVWDEENCLCKCNTRNKNCSTGSKWNEQHCKCQRDPN